MEKNLNKSNLMHCPYLNQLYLSNIILISPSIDKQKTKLQTLCATFPNVVKLTSRVVLMYYKGT